MGSSSLVSGLRLFRIRDFFSSGRLIAPALYKDARASGRGSDDYEREEMRTFSGVSKLFLGEVLSSVHRLFASERSFGLIHLPFPP